MEAALLSSTSEVWRPNRGRESSEELLSSSSSTLNLAPRLNIRVNIFASLKGKYLAPHGVRSENTVEEYVPCLAPPLPMAGSLGSCASCLCISRTSAWPMGAGYCGHVTTGTNERAPGPGRWSGSSSWSR